MNDDRGDDDGACGWEWSGGTAEGDAAFSAARRLGYPDLDALYEAVGRDEFTPETLLGHFGLPASAGQ